MSGTYEGRRKVVAKVKKFSRAVEQNGDYSGHNQKLEPALEACQSRRMGQPLRLLHLEDDPDYSSLLGSKLAAEGIEAELLCVKTKGDFQAALDRGGYDLIIADYSLPDYNGIEAVKLAEQKSPGTPILLVSGTIGEEAAIESLKAGATDYVLKQWPERLVPAVRRALREAEERKSRLLAESRLVRREKLFRALSENALDVVSVLDREGNLRYNSPSALKVLGYQPEELVGQNGFALIHEDDVATARGEFQKCVENPGQTAIAKFRARHRDGSWVYLETVCKSFLDDPEIAGVVVNSRDVTERHKLEEQLLHSQKMEAIGLLAGGVAHDFNNILTVIQGHASLLRAAEKLPEAQRASVDQIYQAAERAAGLTRQLLTFSRRQVIQPKPLDLNTVLGNMTKMLGRILGEDIALQFNYSAGQPWVHADEGMMEQVVMNLAVNSRDAMPAGGKLTIQITVADLKAADLARHPEGRPGKYVCFSVSDTGSGIKPDVLPHIFEPFFTTKAVGKGTGLGLATVYGIVKQHGGWITVQSGVGQGTTFQVYLPAINAAAGKTLDTTADEALPRGTETILVVEDEAPVRELVSSILTTLGYRILEAATGVKALEVWREHHNEIDLLLTDIVMPDGMTGRDLAEKIQAEKPSLKAIYTSGYSSDIVGRDFVLREGLNYLQKPFVPPKLARAVRKCLDGK
jgi:two-component system cell cycle sensor histidine kinase/response regulator CckA